MSVPQIEKDLRARHRRVLSTTRKLEDDKAELLDAILGAVRAGYSLQNIADILGLSKSRAQQLVRQADGRGRSSR